MNAITEKTQLIEAFQTFFSGHRDTVLLVNEDGKIVCCNSSTTSYIETCKIEPAAIKEGQKFINIFPREHQAQVESYLQLMFKTKKFQIIEINFTNIQPSRWFGVRLIPVSAKDASYAYVVLPYLSEAHERTLKAGEEQARMILDGITDAIFVHDTEGNIVEVNKIVCDRLGYTREEILKTHLNQIDSPEYAKEIPARMQELTRRGTAIFESQHLKKDGTPIPVEVNASMIKFHNRQAILGTARDISERKRTQKLLAESEARFRAAFETSVLGMLLTGLDGRMMSVNQAFCEMLGYTQDELIGKNFSQITHPEDQAAGQLELKNLLEGVVKTTRFEKRYLHKNNSTVWIELHAALRRDEKEKPIYIVTQILNISERKKAEKEREQFQSQLVHAAKLASIGTFAAGVAHEINNPLTIISGNIDLLRQELGDMITPGATDVLDRQDKAVKRIADIVNGLRTYARSDTEHVQDVDIHKVVQDTWALVGNIFEKGGVKVELRLKSKTPAVRGNIGKLQQVVMNLLTNARDALETRETGALIVVSTEETDQKVIMKVSDNGTGISKKNVEKIFNAFFTTKPPGKGTGLGLSIIHSIIEGMGGKIEVDSEVGIGTTFVITMPKGDPSAVKTGKDSKPGKLTMTGTALIVDDEEEIRQLLHSYLKEVGLSVDEAENGKQALQKIRAKHYNFVITDVKMPEMTGDVLLKQAHELGLEMTKFVVITGGILTDYSKEQRDSIRTYADGFLNKPFDRKTLLQTLASLQNS